MATVNKNGSTALAMRVSGEMARLMVKENCTTPTVTSTRATGSTTKPTDKVSTLMLMEPGIKASGVMTNSMVTVERHGLITLCMKVCTTRARRTVLAS